MEASLETLMKQHEHAYRRHLNREDYVLIRLDGKAFNSYTRKLQKPFDAQLVSAMDETLLTLCREVPGVRVGYTQSDEISLLITAFKESPEAPDGVQQGELWMGGVEAKLLSLTAALATATFNDVRHRQAEAMGLTRDEMKAFHRGPALFDSRLWTFEATEAGMDLVVKYFSWRQADAVKNSVTMAAQSVASHSELHGLNTNARKAILEDRGEAWDAFEPGVRFGRAAYKGKRTETVQYTRRDTGTTHMVEAGRTFWSLEVLEDAEAIRAHVPRRSAQA